MLELADVKGPAVIKEDTDEALEDDTVVMQGVKPLDQVLGATFSNSESMLERTKEIC